METILSNDKRYDDKYEKMDNRDRGGAMRDEYERGTAGGDTTGYGR